MQPGPLQPTAHCTATTHYWDRDITLGCPLSTGTIVPSVSLLEELVTYSSVSVFPISISLTLSVKQSGSTISFNKSSFCLNNPVVPDPSSAAVDSDMSSISAMS